MSRIFFLIWDRMIMSDVYKQGEYQTTHQFIRLHQFTVIYRPPSDRFILFLFNSYPTIHRISSTSSLQYFLCSWSPLCRLLVHLSHSIRPTCPVPVLLYIKFPRTTVCFLVYLFQLCNLYLTLYGPSTVSVPLSTLWQITLTILLL